MTINQILATLLNKKWEWPDLIWLVFSIVISSIFTTPLLGIPIGVMVYFLLFYKDAPIDDKTEKYDLQDENMK
ncbi:hypothetical protein BU064_12030 [Staphylococcus succinus]|nr:hypothetical protein BU064_12030 [Staphylococcus succinus]